MSSSSFKTISALVNTMIGGTMLTIPILFRQAGIVTGLVILLFSGLISYKTCELYVIHMSEGESSIEDTIHRILGRKWQRFFKWLTGFYLVCLNIIYIDLIVDQFYDVLLYIFQHTGHSNWIADKSVETFVFDRFSVQYLSILMYFPILRMTFIRDYSVLIKLTSLGVIAVVVYITFILWEFGVGLPSIKMSDIPFFGPSVGNLAGTCAIAFTIHTVVNPIMKANQHQDKNTRDLRISYFLGFLIYACIGVLGCLAVLGKQCKTTIINCYLDSWQALSVQVVYFCMLLTVYPCFIQVGRTRLLECYFNPVSPAQYRIFNILFVLVSFFFAFLGPYVPLDLIMNLVGSLLCFFFVYLTPSKFHWNCMYKLPRQTAGSLMSEEEDDRIGQVITCAHGPEYVTKRSKKSRAILYLVINAIGVAVGFFGIFQFFQQILFE